MGARNDRNGRKLRLRRALLAGGALLVAAAEVPLGCAGGFDPPSKVSSLRIFSVQAETPYADPGATVTFKMDYKDAAGAEKEGAAERPVTIAWIGGCFDPPGDDYFGCYSQVTPQLSGGASLGGGLPKDG